MTNGENRQFRTRLLLCGAVALAALALMSPALAEGTGEECLEGTECGVLVGGNGVEQIAVAPNTETKPDKTDRLMAGEGFSLSVDGEVIAGSQTLADGQRQTDLALQDADIQVKFDGLDVRPYLNVTTVSGAKTYAPGETIEFRIGLNYAAWIARADVIISEVDGLRRGEIARVAVDSSGLAQWTVPAGTETNLAYVLRVYDDAGRYDETMPMTLKPADELTDNGGAEEDDGPHQIQNTKAVNLTEDQTALRNIPIQGGAVTVFGRGVAENSIVYAFGENIAVDKDGSFVVQRILPSGDHVVEVEVRDENGKSDLDFTRDINIPTDDWFYVGLADFTLGKRFANKDMKAIYPGEYEGVYNKGRLAFYLKGKIKGRTLLTAALDTGSHDFKNLLKNIDEKDPRRFLKRIDPDDYYPVYGDDSTSIEDAPTSGRFYVRLQRDDSHVMWGNFKAYMRGNAFLDNQRALYGAQGVYKSQKVALDGGRSTEVSAYAAEPGTLSQNDVLRGTGGSAYFLKHQDITQGSETVTVEQRDPVTGFVVSKNTLKETVDYEIDYSQGVIFLTTPLPSTSFGRWNFLVVNYEFTPATSAVQGYAFGGRAQQWLGEHVRVGVSAQRDYSGDAALQLGGADVRLQATENNYIDAHVARSKGNGFGYSQSTDGGLTYSDIKPLAGGRKAANAYGVEAKSDLEEISGGLLKGNFQANYSYREGGFSTLDTEVTKRREDARVAADVELSEKTSLEVEASQSRNGAETERAAKATVKRKLSEHAAAEVFVKDSFKPGTAGAGPEKGHRLDLGAKLSRDIDEHTSGYVFGQGTVLRDKQRHRDDRVGLGGKADLGKNLALEAEASIGTEGPGAFGKLVFTPNDKAKYYFGYELDPYRDLDSSFATFGQDLGHFIFGGKHRVSEELSFFAEDSYDLFGTKRTLAQTYGVNYEPFENWSVEAAVELGHVYDDTINSITLLKNSDFDRKAGSLSVGYRGSDGNIVRAKSEVRYENSEDHTRDLTSYLFEGTVNWKANDDWRVLVNIDAVFADATQATRDGDYVEGSIGFAYRPAVDDRLNALVKYTYLYDLPGADQVTVDGTLNGPYQQSHIFSADAIYDLTERLSLGAKYGARFGATRARTGGAWTNSSAHLAVLRADYNVFSAWDAMLEGRVLWVPESESTQFGLLAAVYRHMGENFKVGLGYNFGRFSDNLADLTADDHGVFINAVGKF